MSWPDGGETAAEVAATAKAVPLQGAGPTGPVERRAAPSPESESSESLRCSPGERPLFDRPSDRQGEAAPQRPLTLLLPAIVLDRTPSNSATALDGARGASPVPGDPTPASASAAGSDAARERARSAPAGASRRLPPSPPRHRACGDTGVLPPPPPPARFLRPLREDNGSSATPVAQSIPAPPHVRAAAGIADAVIGAAGGGESHPATPSPPHGEPLSSASTPESKSRTGPGLSAQPSHLAACKLASDAAAAATVERPAARRSMASAARATSARIASCATAAAGGSRSRRVLAFLVTPTECLCGAARGLYCKMCCRKPVSA